MNIGGPSDPSNQNPRIPDPSIRHTPPPRPARLRKPPPKSVEVDPAKTDKLIGRPNASDTKATPARGAQGAQLKAAAFQKSSPVDLQTTLRTLTEKLQAEVLDPFGETGAPQAVEIPASIMVRDGSPPILEVASRKRSSVEYFNNLQLKTRGNLLPEMTRHPMTVQQACDLSAQKMNYGDPTGSWHDLLHGVLDYSDAVFHEFGPSVMGLAAMGMLMPFELVPLYQKGGPGLEEHYVRMRKGLANIWRVQVEELLEPFAQRPRQGAFRTAIQQLQEKGFLAPSNYKNRKALTHRLDNLAKASTIDPSRAMSELVTLALAEFASKPATFVQDMMLPMAFLDALAAHNQVPLKNVLDAAIYVNSDRSAFTVPSLKSVNNHLKTALTRHGWAPGQQPPGPPRK